MAEKMLMVSLEEDKAKELAQVISNESCRKILNFLTENEAAESDIVKKLNIPASTVNYNIKLLVKNKLIEVKDTLWSTKGNKVNIYKIANKLIIITPKGAENWKNKIKSIFPVALISAVVAGAIHLFSNNFALQAALPEVREAVKMAGMEATDEVSGAALEAAPQASINVINVMPNYGLWFLLGAFFAIILYLLISLWRSKK